MKSLVREPVREAVREALAEERIVTEDQVMHTQRRDDEEQTGNRFFRPAMLLPVLGLVALGAIVRRRKLMELANEKGVIDQTDEMIRPHAPDQGRTADSDSTSVGEPTGHGDYGEGIDSEESTNHGDYGEGIDSEQ